MQSALNLQMIQWIEAPAPFTCDKHLLDVMSLSLKCEVLNLTSAERLQFAMKIDTNHTAD